MHICQVHEAACPIVRKGRWVAISRDKRHLCCSAEHTGHQEEDPDLLHGGCQRYVERVAKRKALKKKQACHVPERRAQEENEKRPVRRVRRCRLSMMLDESESERGKRKNRDDSLEEGTPDIVEHNVDAQHTSKEPHARLLAGADSMSRATSPLGSPASSKGTGTTTHARRDKIPRRRNVDR